jgi:hypothetical protein
MYFVGIFIGPEGGFTAAELEIMEKEKEAFSFVSLGDRYKCTYIYIYTNIYRCTNIYIYIYI